MSSDLSRKLRGLVLSAVEIRQLTSWPDAMIEDYLNILNNFVLLSDTVDVIGKKTIEEIDTAFNDGSIPFAESGFLVEDVDLIWDPVTRIFSANGVHVSAGRRKATTVVDTGPYTPTIYDEILYINTTVGDIDVMLPVGIDGASYRIANIGSNQVNVYPNGLENLFGENLPEYLAPGETIDICFDPIAGWY